MTLTNQTLAGIFVEKGGFQSLLDHLSHIIDVSRKKFDLQRASNSDKQKWARLLITGCEAYGKLLETRKLEVLEERIADIERRGGFNE